MNNRFCTITHLTLTLRMNWEKHLHIAFSLSIKKRTIKY